MKLISKILIIGLILIAIISGSYLAILYREGLSICQNVEVGTAILAGKVKAGGGINNCELIGNKKYDDIKCKYMCIEFAAVNQKSEIICEKILQINYSSLPNYPFYFECLGKVGSEKKDESICKKIEANDERIVCLRSVALAKKDEKICEEILLPTTWNKTISYLNKQDIYDGCLYDIAIINRDSSICDKIPDGKKKTECYTMIEQLEPFKK